MPIHFSQQWYALGDPAMEEALYDMVSMRRFAHLGDLDNAPSQTNIFNFRCLQEKHDLARRLFNRVNAHLSRKARACAAARLSMQGPSL